MVGLIRRLDRVVVVWWGRNCSMVVEVCLCEGRDGSCGFGLVWGGVEKIEGFHVRNGFDGIEVVGKAMVLNSHCSPL